MDAGVAIGLAWLAGTCVLSAHGVEPVATFSFLFAWSGILYTTDRVIAGAEGASLIARLGPRRFLLLVSWSAVNWFAYELANVRLANWYYVFVTDVEVLRFLGTVAAFGTVFPGVFWIDHALRAGGILREPAAARPAAAPLSPLVLLALQGSGVVALALCLADPTRFFPLIWGVTALLVAPWNHRLGVDGWLAQWQRRSWRPTARMLLAGLIAGGCWEFFNVWARARWIYTVPFFDELKLFEMPLLGFLGFPPFALECACVYRLLVWYRLAPPFGAFSQVGPPRGWRTQALAAVVAGGVVTSGWWAVDRIVVASRTPRVADVAALDAPQRRALNAAHVTHLTQLEGWGSAALWRRIDDELPEAAANKLRDLAALYLHRGIGTGSGNRLVAAGFASLEDLRGLTVDEVTARLRAVDAPGPAPSRAQVKVWLRALPPQ